LFASRCCDGFAYCDPLSLSVPLQIVTLALTLTPPTSMVSSKFIAKPLKHSPVANGLWLPFCVS
jgi:hypothetical protein